MKFPPMILKLKIPHSDSRGSFGLWLPLFLAYPFVLVLVVILTPFVLFVSLLLWPSGRGKMLLLSGPYLLQLLFNLHGLRVDIEKQSSRILISFC